MFSILPVHLSISCFLLLSLTLVICVGISSVGVYKYAPSIYKLYLVTRNLLPAKDFVQRDITKKYENMTYKILKIYWYINLLVHLIHIIMFSFECWMFLGPAVWINGFANFYVVCNCWHKVKLMFSYDIYPFCCYMRQLCAHGVVQ